MRFRNAASIAPMLLLVCLVGCGQDAVQGKDAADADVETTDGTQGCAPGP